MMYNFGGGGLIKRGGFRRIISGSGMNFKIPTHEFVHSTLLREFVLLSGLIVECVVMPLACHACLSCSLDSKID